MTGTVSLLTSGPLARVTISHPGKFNAMSRAMWVQLRSVFTAIQQQGSIRCVLVGGEGGHFCSGGDISEYADFRFSEDSLRDFHENDVWGGLQAMLDCDVPIVAQISGNCMGAGLEMASCCDMRIAGESARFGAPIAKLGFPMAPREAALVMSAVGDLTAREILLSAAVLDASTMNQRGFLNSVVTDDALESHMQACVNRVTALAPAAARMNKQAFRALSRANEAGRVSAPIASPYAYADTDEHREGIAAFTEKRPARFVS
ncbi:MAG: enoyl-CoA hydratase/isomerase family protein [Pseudomonadota bacterium]